MCVARSRWQVVQRTLRAYETGRASDPSPSVTQLHSSGANTTTIATALLVSLLAGAPRVAAAHTNPWTGTYKNKSGQHDYHSLIQRLTITKGKGNSFYVQIVLWTLLGSKTGPVKLESEAQGYSDFNDKGTFGDQLIASFPSVKNKPIIVIHQELPFVSVLNEHSRYKHLSYTYYERSSEFSLFVNGDVYRDDSSKP
jgi:hypothetical protein